MGKRKRDRSTDLMMSQTKAQAFVVDYLKTTSVGLPSGLDDPTFAACMNAIVRSMAVAYARGYMDSAEQD